MLYPSLGRSGFKISRIVLGTASFGELTGADDAARIVDAAIDHGVSTFDTATSYVGGRSEELLGEILLQRRSRVVVCTKIGFRAEDDEADHAALLRGQSDDGERWARGIGPNERGLTRGNIVASVEASLRRLRSDHIDLCQLHFWDRSVPIDETLRAMGDLTLAGKVRYWGASQYKGWQLVKAQAVAERDRRPRIETVQLALNLLSRGNENEAIPAAASEEIAVLAFQSFAGGMLSGRYLGQKAPAPNSRIGSRQTYQDRYWNQQTFRQVNRLKTLAAEFGEEMGSLALSWVLSRPGVTAAIVGADNPSDIAAAVAASETPLLPDQIEALDRLGA